MSWETAKDLMLIGLSVSSAVVYDFAGRVSYLVSAGLFLVVWELAGWNGLLSGVALAAGFFAMGLALGHRALTQRPLQSEPGNPKREFLVSFGLFMFWVILAIVISGETSGP